MSRRCVVCGRGWEMGQGWKPGGIGSSMNYGNFFILPAFCRQFPCLSYLFFFLCSYLISSSSTVSKGCDKLQSFNSVMGKMQEFAWAMTFFFFLYKKKEFRVPLSGCGLSTSCWEAMQWSPAEGVQIGGDTSQWPKHAFWKLPSSTALPKARLGVLLFCWTYCFFTATASLFSEEAFQDSTAALAVCEVLASVRPQLWRTVLQEWCSFWVVFFWSPLF